MTPPAARLRRASRADADAIADLHTESWRTVYDDIMPKHHVGRGLTNERRRHWRASLGTASPRDVVLVAESGRQLIGFIAIRARSGPQPAYIDNLHVRPRRRGAGVGRRLMAEAARHLVRAGYRAAYLWVFRANRGAVRFYKRLGGRIACRSFDEFPRARASVLRFVWRDLRRLRSR